ncbi:MAG: DUF3352 domain-containing protein [Cyanobacteriota bacterium]
MKARPFLAVVLAGVLALLFLGIGSWWWVLRSSPLQLQHQPLTVPLASRFVPRQAPLSLHLLTSPDQLEGYARAVTPGRQRRQAAQALADLRDGVFAVAGLDYSQELSGWIGDETSLSLFRSEPDGGSTGWVLALRSRDADGARRFLQRFWQSRSLAGTNLQVSTYRGMGLISGRGALVGQETRPLATALIDDDLVLIASGRGVLEQSLDVSQIDDLNQATSPRFQEALNRIGEGVALITARPEGLAAWLGLPADPALQAATTDLVLALRPDGRNLVLDALLGLSQPLPPLQSADVSDLTADLRAHPSTLALLQDPAQLLGQDPPPAADAQPAADAAEAADSEPAGNAAVAPPPALAWADLLAPTLQALLAAESGPLPALVAAADHGPLLWGHLPEGWLLATAAAAVPTADLAPPLQAQGYVEAPLTLGDRSIQAWSRLLVSPRRHDPEPLAVGLAGVRVVEGAVAWWAQGLAALQAQLPAGSHRHQGDPGDPLAQLQALERPQAPVRLALAADPAQALLLRWQPWRLLGTLTGRSFRDSVAGLALSLEADPAAREGGLRLQARLDLA